MKIKCPNCLKTLTISPDMLIGNFAVCKNCNHIFSWTKMGLLEKKKGNNPKK